MPKRSTTRLNQSLLKNLNPNPPRDYTLYDADLPGFGIRVRTSGTMAFILKYRNSTGRQRFFTLGNYGPMTAQDARQRAIKVLADIAGDADPMADRIARRSVVTIGELCDQYLEACRSGRVRHRRKAKSPETLQNDISLIERHIKPLLGKWPLTQLKRRDVEQFLQDVQSGKTAAEIKTGPRGLARVSGGPGIARKAVKLLATVYNYALREELVPQNPCTQVDTPPSVPRTRWISGVEYGNLANALVQAANEGVNPLALSAIRALALTGCRRNEILNLRRSEVDVAGRCLRLADTKTGPQVRPCGAAALTLLADLAKTHDGEYLFPAKGTLGRLVNIRKPLVHVCRIANLKDVSAHIFRHSYATVAHELGYSELTIAGLLGHAAGSVTSRYAHHVDHALASAADHVSATIAERLLMQQPAALVDNTRQHQHTPL
jgi:integrase